MSNKKFPDGHSRLRLIHRTILLLKLSDFCLQKIIYKFMQISGVVRVIKGPEILTDDSTLKEHGIIDGSTVNIVIEPDRNINLRVKLGPKKVTCSVSSSVRLLDLKQQLIDGGIVGFMLSEFTLVISADDKNGITEDITIEDESLPLHLCGIIDNTTLRVVKWKVVIHLINQKGQHSFKAFPRNMPVNQIEHKLLGEDIILFLQTGSGYRKFDGDAPIGEVLSNCHVVYYIENRFFDPPWALRVYYEDLEIGRIGCVQGDTVLSVKLRVQEQMGFTVCCMEVQSFNGRRLSSMSNCEKIGNGSYWVNIF